MAVEEVAVRRARGVVGAVAGADDDLDVARVGKGGKLVLGHVGGAAGVGAVVALRAGEGWAGDDGGGTAEGE